MNQNVDVLVGWQFIAHINQTVRLACLSHADTLKMQTVISLVLYEYNDPDTIIRPERDMSLKIVNIN
ncbi:hypothetical protein ACTXT7_005761 [Hymenolepis weldensis]